MTREEAKSCISTIEMLQRLAYNIHGVMDVIDADNCEKIIKALEQEPSGDLISRQDAIDAIWDGINMDIYTREVKETLEELPSVKQEPKTGHWITVEMTQGDGCRYTVTYCSECDEDVDYRTDYCPNCGCRMVEPQESEDKE